MDQLVIRSDSQGIATLTLNRPEKLNALVPRMFEELQGHLDDIGNDNGISCVVLTGAGRSFCAGHDLNAIAAGERGPTPTFEAEVIDVLEALPQPTIAKIRGHCLTGGLELALGCDLLICSTTSTFADTHGQWGLVPIWGLSVRLPERVGRARAQELMFTSRRIDGPTASAIGLVNHCVDDQALDDAVDAVAAEIAANSPGTNRIVKRLLSSSAAMSRAAALEHERGLPFGTAPDRHERLRSAGRSS